MEVPLPLSVKKVGAHRYHTTYALEGVTTLKKVGVHSANSDLILHTLITKSYMYLFDIGLLLARFFSALLWCDGLCGGHCRWSCDSDQRKFNN